MLAIKKGNIFTSKCKCIVNAVNCTGVMGAGIALELKLRYPEMFESYSQYCESGMLTPGKLWLYREKKNLTSFSSILSFPTKNNWKHPSKLSYVEQGLIKFVASYEKLGLKSVAFPLLGVGRGGLELEQVLPLMEKYLSSLPIDIEIWHYDSKASDDIVPILRQQMAQNEISHLAKNWQITLKTTEKIVGKLSSDKINSLAVLLTEKGIGDATVSKLIDAAGKPLTFEPTNLSLFNS